MEQLRARTQPRRRWALLALTASLSMLAASCVTDPATVAGAQPAGPTETSGEPVEEPEPAAPPADVPTGEPAPADSAASPADPPAPADSAASPADPPAPADSAASPADPPAPADPAAPPAPEEAPAPPPPPLADLEGLAEGASGEGVTRLEQRLAELSYPPGPVDQTFDVRTARALTVFQSDHGLDAAGRLDGATIAALASAAPAEVLGPGSGGPAVSELQQRLNDGPYDAGPVDGQYGTMTAQAVYALQKLHGYPVTGTATPVERFLAGTGGLGPRLVAGPQAQEGLHVEVDLAQQLVTVFRDGDMVLASHASSGNRETFCTPAGGCRRAVTPTGDYTITRRIDGWRTSELGELYNPLYFNGGIAFHGAYSVPTSPASHGCVRLPMHIADYLPDLLPNGTPVIVR